MPLKALLIDIDGTIMFQGQAIAGAARALRDAAQAGLAVRLLTNISARLPREIAADLHDCGIDVDESTIFTAGTACSAYLRATAGVRCHLLVPPAMEALFDGVCTDAVAPDCVVIGDVAERFDYDTLNHVFRLLRNGARLVVPHRNLFWHDRDGPRLDAGAFILGLEAAAGVSAMVTGKPSKLFFQSALESLGVSREEAMVVGDDVLTDIAGAQALGLSNVLVRTGKGRAQRSVDGPRPQHEIGSIADLIGDLQRCGLLGCPQAPAA